MPLWASAISPVRWGSQHWLSRGCQEGVTRAPPHQALRMGEGSGRSSPRPCPLQHWGHGPRSGQGTWRRRRRRKPKEKQPRIRAESAEASGLASPSRLALTQQPRTRLPARRVPEWAAGAGFELRTALRSRESPDPGALGPPPVPGRSRPSPQAARRATLCSFAYCSSSGTGCPATAVKSLERFGLVGGGAGL